MKTSNRGRFFKKGNSYESKPVGNEPLKAVLTIRVTKEPKNKIKTVPNWQEKVRQYMFD
ncbi:MAG: hypothetical protein WBF90_14415 [Rivularia sp. (in: cyanobacteria)]|jgi:hypothetical protein